MGNLLGRLVSWVGAHALQVLGGLVLAAGIAYVSVAVDDAIEPTPSPPAPDTVEVERTITRRDTVTQTVPEMVVRYDTVRVRDTIQVVVPEDFRYLGVIERRPLDISEGQATLTYFRNGRYVQQRYDLPEQHWALWPEVEVRTTPWGVEGRVQGALRWRDWTVTAGYAFARERWGWTVGVRWRPVGVSW